MRCECCGELEGQGECAECRALARELNANAEALSALRSEVLPALVLRVPRRTPIYPLLAVAAALLLAVLAGVKHPATKAPVRFSEPLKIKMLTPDPDVVIYWLVDSGKEEQR